MERDGTHVFQDSVRVRMAVVAGLVISSIAAATGLGSLGHSLANPPSTPNISTTPATTPINAQQAAQLKGTISGQDANIQAQTGGSLSPDYLTQIAPLLSGVAGPGTSGIAQGATNTFTGAGSNPIAQVIKALSSGGGGAPSASAQSFTPAGLTAQPGTAGADFLDNGLSSLQRSLGIQV